PKPTAREKVVIPPETKNLRKARRDSSWRPVPLPQNSEFLVPQFPDAWSCSLRTVFFAWSLERKDTRDGPGNTSSEEGARHDYQAEKGQEGEGRGLSLWYLLVVGPSVADGLPATQAATLSRVWNASEKTNQKGVLVMQIELIDVSAIKFNPNWPYRK